MNLGLFNCFVDLKWTYSLQGGWIYYIMKFYI